MHFSAQSHRTNNIMRTLTVLTAIFLPLNLVTGFFGMNFDRLPLIHSSRGFWVVVAAAGADRDRVEPVLLAQALPEQFALNAHRPLEYGSAMPRLARITLSRDSMRCASTSSRWS